MSDSPPTSDPPAGEPAAARLRSLLSAAEPLVVSDAGRAEALLHDALVVARSLGDARHEALTLTLLSATWYFRSQYQVAIDILGQALVAADRAQDPLVTARIENSLGICAVALGHYGEGMEHYQNSLRTAQAAGDDEGRARVLSNVGLIHAELGEYQLALQVFQEVLTLARTTGLPLAYASALINQVFATYHVSQPEEALTLALEALPVVQDLGLRQNEVVLRAWMLPCLLDTGRPAEALCEAEKLLPLALDVNDQQYVVYVRLFTGQALMQLGQLDAAHKQLHLALDEARQYRIRAQEKAVLYQLGQLFAARQEWQPAYEVLQAYLELDRALHAETVERRAQVMAAQLQIGILRREAEAERQKSTALTHANTALQAAQEALTYRATHDALTGLANRAHFHAEMERTLQGPAETSSGVLFIDLDRFKQVNDTLGHDVGDELLKEVARRLTRVVRSGDLVARLGGDEFTILLRDLRTPQDAQRVAHKVLEALARPMQLGTHTLRVTGSIGVAVAPHDGQDVTSLQKHADSAMYRAKHEGKNGVRVWTSP